MADVLRELPDWALFAVVGGCLLVGILVGRWTKRTVKITLAMEPLRKQLVRIGDALQERTG